MSPRIVLNYKKTQYFYLIVTNNDIKNTTRGGSTVPYTVYTVDFVYIGYTIQTPSQFLNSSIYAYICC